MNTLLDVPSTGMAARVSEHGLDQGDWLLEQAPVALCVCDRHGLIVRFNQRAAELWGRRPRLRDPGERFCGAWRLYKPDGDPLAHTLSAAAQVLRCAQPVNDQQYFVARPDGSRVRVAASSQPLRDRDGRLLGVITTLVDMSNLCQDQQLQQRLAAIVEGSQDAIVSKDLSGTISSWNAGAEVLFGYSAAEIVGKPITLIIPPQRHDEEREILARLRRGERIEHYETVRVRKDGTPVEVSLSVSPLRDAQGRVVGASKVARDIGARKRAQEQQELLLREMSHRIKNVFALINSMVALSARSASTPEALAETLQARMRALARAHELTLPAYGGINEPDRTTTLHALLHAIVAPHAEAPPEHRVSPADSTNPAGSGRLSLNGPDIPLCGNAVTSLALLLHELTTNAAKHGALSVAAGRVSVEWAVEQDELHLTWRECGGPTLGGPVPAEGFGSVLVRQTIAQLQGRISREFHAQGLAVQLWVGLQCLTS